MALSKKKIEEIFRLIHSGKLSIENLPIELSQFTYDELMKFVKEGFGELSTDVRTGKYLSYEKNITAFSGAKTFQNVKDLSSFVFNEKGEKRSFREFKEFARQIDEKYNVKWLKTEQDTSFGVAQGADQWLEFEDNKDLFPLLQYQTANDERVRAEHAAWDGIIRPVDDHFWDMHMPPNSWNCRCSVIQLEEGKVTNLRGVKQNDDPMFSVNPGKVDYIFNEKKHPYFQHTKAEGPAFERSLQWGE